MKVMFVYPDQVVAHPGWEGYFYCGLGILSSVLKNAGHQTSLIHITKPDADETDIARRIEEARPDLLAFSCTTLAFPLAASIAKRVKQTRPDLPTVVGGVHACLAADKCINTPGIDIVCRGEGEYALLDLANAMQNGADYAHIPGLWVRDGDTVVQNPVRPLITDLDALPFTDRTIFDYQKMHWESRGWATCIMSRGCAYSCTYCGNHALKKLHEGQPYVRFRSVDNIIAELEQILKDHSFVTGFNFDDDLPFASQKFTEEFCEKYKARIHLPFRFNLRPNVAFEDRLRLIKDAGGAVAKVGLESGNDFILNDVLKRHLTVAQTENAFHACHRAGLTTQSFNMVGLPHETPRMVLDTVKLNAKASSELIQVSIFYPFPGTQLWEQCAKEGIINPDAQDPTDYFSDSVLEQKSITPAQVRFFHHRFHNLVRIYRWALANGRSDSNWRVRLLDTLLLHGPSRSAMAVLIGVLRKVSHLLRKPSSGTT